MKAITLSAPQRAPRQGAASMRRVINLSRRVRFAAMMGTWLLAMYGICTDSAVAIAAGTIPVLPLAFSLCPKGGEA